MDLAINVRKVDVVIEPPEDASRGDKKQRENDGTHVNNFFW